MLQIENLSKKYNHKTVLDNINLTLEPNKIYGIVGHNGAGKTTFFKCLLGIEKFQGKIRESRFDILKNYTGYLPADLFFFSRITAKEYLAFMLSGRQINIKHIDIEKANIFKLPLNEYCSSYSTGMKKQLAFMAIMLQENAYYILDEPFNGLDLRSNLILKHTILSFKKTNRTIFISSHILSTLTEICDEIYAIKNGVFLLFQPPQYPLLETELLS